MTLLTKELADSLPRLYTYEYARLQDIPLLAHFFTPDSSWNWWPAEYDPEERIFWGLVRGHEEEWGYFSLEEMESVRGPWGLPIERDLHFTPVKAGAVMKGGGE